MSWSLGLGMISLTDNDQGRANKVNVLVEVCYRLPNQDEEADEVFYKQLARVTQLLALVPVRDFNLPEVAGNIIQQRVNSLGGSWSAWKVTQLVREPTRGSASLDLMFTNRKGNVVIGNCLRKSSYEMVEFSILGELRRGGQQNCYLGLPKSRL